MSLCICSSGTYIPHKEVTVRETVQATIIKPNQAIKLRARKECIDREGSVRVTGEEWLVKKTGAYLPGAYEEVVDVVNAYVLTEKVYFVDSHFYDRTYEYDVIWNIFLRGQAVKFCVKIQNTAAS